jgi:iron complex outermembrane receptor protein
MLFVLRTPRFIGNAIDDSRSERFHFDDEWPAHYHANCSTGGTQDHSMAKQSGRPRFLRAHTYGLFPVTGCLRPVSALARKRAARAVAQPTRDVDIRLIHKFALGGIPMQNKKSKENCSEPVGRTLSRSSTVCIAVLVAAMTLLGGASAFAQQPSGPAATALEEIVVTGSLLKRTDTETPSPVQVISAADLLNSGYTNVSDVLRNLAANGQGTLSQGFTEAFAAGASGIALRGLTVGGTLTLIDSERMVAYPLSDDGQRSFVDVTAIPFNAIDSVEVLKDGASAVYGADAIAGVVNIKLKKTYVGSEITAEAGSTQHNDGHTMHVAAILGWGDLQNDGYNIYATLDWHRQEEILGSNRNGPWSNLNWSSLPGGLNSTPGSPTAASFVYPDSIQGYLINPTTPNAAGVYPNGLPGRVFLKQGPQPGCDSAAAQAAGQCEFSFPGQIQPPTEQTNFLTKMTKALTNDWTLTVTASLFDSKAEQVAPETPPFGHAFNQTGQESGSIQNIGFGPGVGPNLVVYPVLSLPATSPQNPFGTAANLVYSFPDIGPLVTDVETTTYRLFGDLKGTAGGWDLDAAVGVMYARMSDHIAGYIEPAVAQADLNNLSYVPGVSTNGASLFAPVEVTDPSSTLGVVDFHGARELFEMPGGPFTLGAGAQYIHKAQNYADPPTVASGVQEGAPAFSVGSQDDAAAFLEVGGKPLRQLEVNAAVRYDHYDTYGGSATPKFGVKYSPVDMFTVRGTWGKGFRAPSISESAVAGTAFGEGNTNDPALCPGGVANVKGTFNALCSYPAVGVNSSNRNLKAVTSTNATFGVIFEPAPIFNASVDYYRIQLKNDIISASEAGGFGADFTALVRGAPALLAQCTNTTTNGTPCNTVNVLTNVNGVPTGYPAYELIPYINAGITTTSGIDVDLRSRFDIGIAGRLTLDVNVSHMLQYEYGYEGTTYDLVGTHGPSGISGDTGNPRDRAVASLTWDKGPFSSTLSVNYTSSFSITDPSAGYDTCLEALESGAPSAYGSAISSNVTTLAPAWYPYCSVAHFTDVNLYARYAATDHLSVHASITNLFNSDAPVDLQTYGGGAEFRYDAALHQDGAIGRFFLLGATFTF